MWLLVASKMIASIFVCLVNIPGKEDEEPEPDPPEPFEWHDEQ